MINILVQIIFFVSAIALIVLILLQHSKGADMGASFGAGASATVFGARGSASFMYKTTRLIAIIFFMSALGLGFLENKTAHSGGILAQSNLGEKKVGKTLDIPIPISDNRSSTSDDKPH